MAQPTNHPSNEYHRTAIPGIYIQPQALKDKISVLVTSWLDTAQRRPGPRLEITRTTESLAPLVEVNPSHSLHLPGALCYPPEVRGEVMLELISKGDDGMEFVCGAFSVDEDEVAHEAFGPLLLSPPEPPSLYGQREPYLHGLLTILVDKQRVLWKPHSNVLPDLVFHFARGMMNAKLHVYDYAQGKMFRFIGRRTPLPGKGDHGNAVIGGNFDVYVPCRDLKDEDGAPETRYPSPLKDDIRRNQDNLETFLNCALPMLGSSRFILSNAEPKVDGAS